MKLIEATNFHRKSLEGLGTDLEEDPSAVGAALNRSLFITTDLFIGRKQQLPSAGLQLPRPEANLSVALDKVEGFVKGRDFLTGERAPRVGQGEVEDRYPLSSRVDQIRWQGEPTTIHRFDRSEKD